MGDARGHPSWPATIGPSIRRLAGAILPEQNDEWAVQRCRTMTRESIAPIGDDPLVSLPKPRSQTSPALPVIVVEHIQLHHATGHDPPSPPRTGTHFIRNFCRTVAVMPIRASHSVL